MHNRILLRAVFSTSLVFVLDVCSRPVPVQLATKPVPGSPAAADDDENRFWRYRPTARRLTYSVDQRAQLVVREDTLVWTDSVFSRAEVFFAADVITQRLAGSVTAFTVKRSGRAAAVPLGLSLPFPFVAAYVGRGQLAIIAPSASPCIAPALPVVQSLRDLWFHVPDTLRLGTTWEDSVLYLSCRDGVRLRSIVRHTFTLSEVIQQSGNELLILRRISHTVISRDDAPSRETVSVSGIGSGELMYTVDPLRGEVLTARGSSLLDLSVHGKTRTQSVRQVGKIEIDRLP